MSHEISTRENGFVEFAFTGERNKIWHGLGNEIPENARLEEWKEKAGMDWEVKTSPVQYYIGSELKTSNNQQVLYRSDTHKELSVKSNDFHIVQPGEVIEFFHDLIKEHDMKMTTAGVLFDGRRFWAMAEIGEKTKIMNKDEIEAYLFLTTAVDGTLKTTAKFTSTRIVCNNTMNVAMGDKGDSVVWSQTHKSPFNAQKVHMNLGFMTTAWNSYVENLHKLAETPVKDDNVRDLFRLIYTDELKIDPEKGPTKTQIEKENELVHKYNNGMGSEYSKGTMYGILNAVTEIHTHGSAVKTRGKQASQSSKFWNSYMGKDSDFKQKALDKLLEVA